MSPARRGSPEADGTQVVHLLRHGEVHNPDRILYGRLPGFGLSPDGVWMAERAAAALSGRDVALVVTSPLERTRQTAAPVAAALGVATDVDERLIEPTNVFEGRTFGVGNDALRVPRFWWQLRNPFTPSWGEPYAGILARVLAAVGDARGRADGREVVCVTHQLPIWVTRRWLEDRPLWHRPDRRLCGLASLTAVTFRGDRAVAVRYSEPAGAAARRPVPAGA